MSLRVGLDFGTTTSVVARAHQRTGELEPLDLDPAIGSINGVVPSAVLYEEGSDVPLVGTRAENTDPARAIRSVKPLLGREGAGLGRLKVLELADLQHWQHLAETGVLAEIPKRRLLLKHAARL